MAKILSFGRRSGSEKNIGRGNPLKSVWGAFQSLDKFEKFFILTALLIIVATPFIVNNYLETRQKAEGPQEITPISTSKEAGFISNELLIKFKKGVRGSIKEGKADDTGFASLDKIHKDFKVEKFEKIAKAGKNSKQDAEIFAWYKVTLEGKGEKIAGKLNQARGVIEAKTENPALEKLQQLIDEFLLDPNIQTVEPNYVAYALEDTATQGSSTIQATPSESPTQAPTPSPISSPTPTSSPGTVPNDPYYSSIGSWGQSFPDLYGIKKINPEPAWNQTTGSTNIIVADVDTGVDRNHEDLQGNMWVNTADIPGNGVDDDGNGYIDDYYGWDWYNNDNDPMDDHGHGTHTAGTIAAVGNNSIGVVGVNWTSKVMALKFMSAGGSGSSSGAAKALQYAADMGARVSSNSWGCSCQSSITDDAVTYEHDRGMVIAVAAGNSNIDALYFSPASSDRAITAAASDQNDLKASFSNYGEKIDVAAPGVDILSTRAAVNPMCTATRTVGTNYCRVSGTSMATPHVAGLAALLLARNPTLTNEEIRQIIRGGADDLGIAGKDASYGYGRINATGSMNLTDTKPLAPIITSPKSRTVASGTGFQVLGSVPGPNFASYKIEAGEGREPTTWKQIASSTSQVIDGILGTIDTTKLNDGLQIIRVTATDTSNRTYQFQVYDIEIDNFDAEITSPASIISRGIVDIFGTASAKNGQTFASYKIEWGSGAVPISWSTTGITLVNGGNQAVSNGKLGTWDTSAFGDVGVYFLRLTVLSAIGVSTSTTIATTVDKDLVKGWPKIISYSGINTEGRSPVLADINGDGISEIIFAGPDGKIYVYNRDASSFPGFPLTVTTTEQFSFPPNVIDLDGDGKKEIIVSTGSKIYIIRNDGTFYPGWPNVILYSIGVSPTVADLNGDGKKDLVAIDRTKLANTRQIHAFQLDGSELTGFPKTFTVIKPVIASGVPEPTQSSIADLDNDGKVEIAYSVYDRIFLFDNAGNILPNWPVVPATFDGYSVTFAGDAPALGDIDGDGNLEIFVWGWYYGNPVDGDPLYAIRKDGSYVSGWPKKAGDFTGGHYSSPSVADIDGDGKDELVLGNFFRYAVWDMEGNRIVSEPSLVIGRGPALSDLDGDGKLEFFSSSGLRIRIYKDNSSILWERSLWDTFCPVGGICTTFNKTFHQAAVADLDRNGKIELATSFSEHDIDTKTGRVSIYLWEIPNTGGGPAKYDWPMALHDPARTGRLIVESTPSPSSSPSPTPSIIPVTPPAGSDTQPPTVSITAPVNGAIVARNFKITIQAGATDNVAVARVDFLVNGSLICSDATAPYSCNWKTSGKPNVTYTLTAKAYDTSGNTASVSITVKSTK